MNTNSFSNAGSTALDHATSTMDQAANLTQRGADAVRDGVQQVRNKAHDLGDHAVTYIKDEPVKSVLIAAATGATLMGILSLMVRSGRRG